MKTYFKHISFCLVLALGFASCESDEGYREEPTDLEGYAYLSNRSISRFDRNSDLSLKIFTAEGVNAETVEIVQGGEVIGTATVSGETATFNTSILGDFLFTDEDGVNHETGSYPIRIRTTYSNGNVSEDAFTVAVGKAISLDAENPVTTTMDSLSNVSLSYEVSTFSANVDEVSLMLKKNSDGTYVESGVDLSTEEGTVVLSETNYEELDLQVNDTLFYKFTATSGNLTDEVVSTVVITPKSFTNSNSVTLSNDREMNQLDLETGELFAEGAEEGEIRFLEPNGFEAINGADIEFVMVEDDFFNDADVLSAAAEFALGTPVTSVTDLENGDVLVYKVTREVEDEDGNVETLTYYGVMRIGNVTVVNGNVVNLEIEYAEGR